MFCPFLKGLCFRKLFGFTKEKIIIIKETTYQHGLEKHRYPSSGDVHTNGSSFYLVHQNGGDGIMIDWFKLFRWFLIVFTIYIIFEVIKKILGGSLGFEELAITLLVTNLGFTFSLNKRFSQLVAKVSSHLGWHTGRKDF